ncbi:MAG: DEAD/DEAH box helicase [Pseudomonadota bacterium]
MSFENLKLDPRLLRAVAACHFKEPTDIQLKAIPVALEGRDLMASAQTGTGKTAAFVLPLLQRLLTTAPAQGRGPRVLVLTPTRELAMQVTDNIRQFSRECHVTSGSVVGGVGYGPQIQLLGRPLDFLVATPGRLMDHMESGRVDFSRLEVMVLDEADRMLDMGFLGAVKTIAKALPAKRQTLLFSATLEGQVLTVAQQLLRDPVRISLATNSDQHASIAQQIHEVDDVEHKHALLTHYLKDDALYQAVIFIATKHGADKLAKKLAAQGHASAALHGNMNQNQRKRAVDRMRRGEFRVLVATDVAARGLDIRGLSHVFNFDLPMVAEDYIHRIGRTGRAGATGTAISFVDSEDRYLLKGIERLTGRSLTRQVIPGLEPKRPPGRSDRPSGAKHRPFRRNDTRPAFRAADSHHRKPGQPSHPRRDRGDSAPGNRSPEADGNRVAAPRQEHRDRPHSPHSPHSPKPAQGRRFGGKPRRAGRDRVSA